MKTNPAAYWTISGPKPLPIVGWRGSPLFFALDPFDYTYNLYKKYGEFFTITQGGKNFIFGCSPEYNRQVLGNTSLFHNVELKDSPLKLPPDSANFRLMSKGLNMINGDKHKQIRRLMMPAFHRKRVEAYRDSMVALTEQKLQGWHLGQTLDLAAEAKQLTLEIAVTTLLGLEKDDNREKTRRMIEEFMRLVFAISTLLLPINIPGLPYHKTLKLGAVLETEFKQIVERKRANNIDSDDVLSMLIQAQDEDGSKLNDDEVLSNLLTLFVAGHETTANTLTWTLFLLSQHPAILKDLRDELTAKLQGNAPTIEQLNQLPLLEAVIKESMRLLPPFLWGLRSTTAATELEGYPITAGTPVTYLPMLVHRRPELYPQPDKFLPRRWETIDPSPYEYLPFAAGARMCIGSVFAMMELKIVLAIILQRYQLTTPINAKIDRTGFILSTPKKGLPMLVYAPDRILAPNSVTGNIHKAVKLS